ncbi:MAG: HAMP domain-containing histidine kinase [Sulfuritalea sp.]|nr:HAMP domain-containing histidine kinase [Sulfuritalea sp.]
MESAIALPSAAPSLRFKFAASFAVVGILLVLLHAAAVLLLNRYQEAELIDQIVSDEIEELIEQYERREMVASPPNATLQHFDVRPETDRQSLRKWFRANWLTHSYIARYAEERKLLPAELVELEPGFHDIESGRERYRVEVREIGAVRFYLAYSIEHHRDRLAQFDLALGVSVVVTAIFGIALGLWLAAQLTRQVGDLAARVERLHDGSAGEVLERHYPDREVAALARAFDAFQRRMALLLERERAFTADVSHELRTPLTSIQTSSELMLEDDSLSSKARERVAKIARASARLSELINAFLLLAREQADGSNTEIDLRSCVDEIVEQVRERAESKGLRIEVGIPTGSLVQAPLNALSVVLSNLLANAVSYTDRGAISLNFNNSCIEIADTGSGIATGKINELFRRFQRGDAGRGEGFGLGLAIVKRICEQTGWPIDIEGRPGGGTCIKVGPI